MERMGFGDILELLMLNLCIRFDLDFIEQDLPFIVLVISSHHT
jgi:hypothetical protein